MEAIWKLADKWKISTQGAIAFFVICTCSLVLGTCIVAALRRNVRRRTEDQEPRVDDSTNIDCSEPQAELGPVKEVLTNSVRWSQKDKLSPLLVSGDQLIEADFGCKIAVQLHLCGNDLYLWVKSVSCQTSVVLYSMIREVTPLHQVDNGFKYDQVKHKLAKRQKHQRNNY